MIKPFKVNMLTGLVMSIVLLGVISASMTLVTTGVYRDLTFDFQRDYMTQLVSMRAQDILDEQSADAARLGLRIQGMASFRQAFYAGDADRLRAELEDQFRQGIITANIVRVLKLHAFDPAFEPLAEATRGALLPDSSGVVCPEVLAAARGRSGAEKLKPYAGLCSHGDRPYQAVIVPVGGLQPSGYLMLVSDPVPAFAAIDGLLQMPVVLESPAGEPLYRSGDWEAAVAGNAVMSDYRLTAGDARPVLRITAVRDADSLVAKLDRTNTWLLAVVAVVILLVVLTALWFLRNSVFKPLRDLSFQLREGRLGRASRPAEPEEHGVPVSFHALGELYETLRDMAIRDPLTRTYNRALFEDRLKQAIAEHRRNPTSVAILLIDMVRFKYVNDLLGHHTGDLLLKQVVDRISSALRESDTLARLGGDEFTVILPDTDGEQALQVAGKIITVMEDDFAIERHKLSASVSIGIAMMPEHGENVETLLRHADYAMYSAKRKQPGCAIYDPKSTAEINAARMTLDGMLNENIEHNDLFLVYQPVMEFRSGGVSYLEALVRWRQADGKVILPDTFIRVAEQSGLIRQLSEWIIGTACRELAMLKEHHPGLRVGINLSMHNLHDYDLAEQICRSLASYRLNPESLLLEITETGVMLDPDQVVETLDELSGMGLKLSVDDFGTGHSSLAYLKRLPVHTLKVDKSFVTDMDADEDNASIVLATIDLAHSLGLSVTAEGVETRAVYEMLWEMGCDCYQGYYVSEPLELKAISGWLDSDHMARQAN
jgi:diguanylate cyclase (GGDEF)-like protein